MQFCRCSLCECCSFDFLMCNPPFFSCPSQTGGVNPNRALNATPSELVCLGGEEAFVGRLIVESKARATAAAAAGAAASAAQIEGMNAPPPPRQFRWLS